MEPKSSQMGQNQLQMFSFSFTYDFEFPGSLTGFKVLKCL